NQGAIGGRTIEKSCLAVLGSKSEMISNLLRKIFCAYCKIMDLKALPTEVDTLVSFLVWLDLSQYFSRHADFLAAVSRTHLEAQLADPSKEYRVKRVYRALLKEYRQARDLE
ncbi:4668_t:CDS:2, partial [Racocetra persica]